MLSINKLHQEINEREEKKKNVYEKILKICYNKIIAVNNKSDVCNCIFVCPNYIYGLPLFNIMSCCLYIMEDLQSKGFNVQFSNPNLLYIDWKVNPKVESKNELQYNGSNQNSLEYSQFRDIMDIQNNNLLYGNQQINNSDSIYKNEFDDILTFSNFTNLN